MNKTRAYFRACIRVFLRHWPLWVFFVAACLLHFWYVILHFGSVLYGGPGDHTAGIIWLYDHYPQTPWWRATDAAGFPFPQKLWDPAYAVSQGFYIFYWLCAKISGSGVAGYNLLVFVLLGLSFAAVYAGLIRMARVGRVVAALLAYGVVFNSFMLACIAVGHASYLLAPAWSVAIFFASISLFTSETMRWRMAGIVALLLGLTWAFDPYFILFVWVIFGLVIIAVLFGRYAKVKETLKRAVLVALAALVLFAPIVIYGRLHQAAIAEGTGGIRNTITADLMAYSARIEDYFLPAGTNPLVPQAVKDIKKNSFHNSLPFTLFIGIVPIAVMLAYGAMRITGRLQKPTNRHDTLYHTLGWVVIAGLVAVSLPPYIVVFGHMFLLPSGIIGHFVMMWRVVARAYIFFMPILAIVVGMYAVRLQGAWIHSRRMGVVAAILLGALTIGSFLNRNPFDATKFWDIKKSLPATYQRIASDSSIHVLAEYPLREQPHYRGSLYFTAQLYHHKKLLNSYRSKTGEDLLRESLIDLNNPQTLRTLRYLGIDTIQVWRNSSFAYADDDEVKEQLNRIDSTRYDSMFSKGDEIDLYHLAPHDDGIESTFVSYINVDLRPGDDRITNIKQGVPQYFELGVYDLCTLYPKPICKTRPSGLALDQHVRIDNTSGESRQLTLRDNGKDVATYVISAHETKDLVIPRTTDTGELLGFLTDKPGGIEVSQNYTTIRSN